MDRFEVMLNRELLPASKGERAMGLGGYFALWVLFSQHGRYEDEPVYLPLHESVDVIQLGFSVKPGRAQDDIAVLLQYDFLYAIGNCHIRLLQSIGHDDSYDVSPFILNVPGKPVRRVIQFLHGVQDFFLGFFVDFFDCISHFTTNEEGCTRQPSLQVWKCYNLKSTISSLYLRHLFAGTVSQITSPFLITVVHSS